MSAAQKCCFHKAGGVPCQAPVVASGDYCFFHDPERAAERKAAGAKGGRRSRKRPLAILPLDAEDMPLDCVTDVVRALATTFNAVRRGQLDPKTGNCLGLIAGQLLRALQDSELAAEIEELAKEIQEIKSANSNAAKPSEEAAGAGQDDQPAGDASAATLAV
jgi:hypothetical protein